MQQQLRGSDVSFASHKQAWPGSHVPTSQRPPPAGAWRPEAHSGGGGPGAGAISASPHATSGRTGDSPVSLLSAYQHQLQGH